MCMKKIKITHLTSAHPRYDTRIYVKECCSLARVEGYLVSLIVSDDQRDELSEGVQVYDVGRVQGRLNRIFKTTNKVFIKAKELDSDIYHFHDPELIHVGLRLKRLGKKVIFDIHEDVAKQILAKPYLGIFSKKVLSALYASYEKRMCKRFDCLVVPTPLMHTRFQKINPCTVEVRNYPILEELLLDQSWSSRKNSLCHIGSLAKARGIIEIIESLSVSHLRLELGGDFRPAGLEEELRDIPEWKYVDYHGYLSRTGVKEVLSMAKVGLVTLHPTDSYIEAIPVKMFEYMAAGIPVIASDFPFYRELLRGYDCAIFVDPLDPQAIAMASQELIKDESRAEKMGQIGKQAVIDRFNWSHEEKKLFKLYKDLLQ